MESVYYSKLGVCCVCTCQLLCCTWLVWVTDWTVVIYCCSLLMYVKSVYYSILGVYTCMPAAVLYFTSVGNWLDITLVICCLHLYMALVRAFMSIRTSVLILYLHPVTLWCNAVCPCTVHQYDMRVHKWLKMNCQTASTVAWELRLALGVIMLVLLLALEYTFLMR